MKNADLIPVLVSLPSKPKASDLTLVVARSIVNKQAHSWPYVVKGAKLTAAKEVALLAAAKARVAEADAKGEKTPAQTFIDEQIAKRDARKAAREAKAAADAAKAAPAPRKTRSSKAAAPVADKAPAPRKTRSSKAAAPVAAPASDMPEWAAALTANVAAIADSVATLATRVAALESGKAGKAGKA